ncbi:ABC transporter substrate-binding protein [Desulfoluna limicola]|uniref:ABC transporter substrate-binding protein n=1 Tax=Desulfoluna limicola TaxID=2810562 RepID=A0ABN6FAX7_9BACT|nr:ABC transporter substrate-binding protein [Desulfoluna limicola]BCS99040.1 ABC transporter substrate-binding protein [Desulfoluna limicola]
MKRATLLFGTMVTIFLLAGGATATVTEVSVYCDDNYPPYSYEVDGQARGVYTAILNTAFSRMEGYRVTIVPIPWKRGLHYIKSGEGFAIFPPYYRPETRPYMWPYSDPILREELVVFCRQDVLTAAPRKKWPDDFFGLTLGQNAGFLTGGEAFDEAVKKGDITIDEAMSNRINILKLGIRRVDCYINARLSIAWELNRLKKEGLYDEGGKHDVLKEALVISSEWGYLGFTRMDFGRFYFKEDFIAKFNTVIHAMHASGELQSIIDRVIASPE